MSNNLSTVHQMFASFGQGDLPGVISRLADNVTFHNGADPNKLPIGGTYKGKDGAMEYFNRLLSTQTISALVPTNFKELNDGKIQHDVHQEGTIPATGKPYSIDMQFTWSFDDAGKVSEWKAVGDFSNLESASMN